MSNITYLGGRRDDVSEIRYALEMTLELLAERRLRFRTAATRMPASMIEVSTDSSFGGVYASLKQMNPVLQVIDWETIYPLEAGELFIAFHADTDSRPDIGFAIIDLSVTIGTLLPPSFTPMSVMQVISYFMRERRGAEGIDARQLVLKILELVDYFHAHSSRPTAV